MPKHVVTENKAPAEKQRELKKLSRTELLEMLLDVTRENDILKAENEELKARMEDRRIRLEESGSIAEAALKLNGIFEAAQKAADQYLDSVRARHIDDGGDDDEQQ